MRFATFCALSILPLRHTLVIVPHIMAKSSPLPSTWVVTDGTIGMEKQCLALAKMLGVTPVQKRIKIRAPWRWLPPKLWPLPLMALAKAGENSALAPPWPDLVIATGRKSVAPALAIRRQSGGATYCVQLQNPGVDPKQFDLVVCPQHDQLEGTNIMSTLGAIHDVDPSQLASAKTQFAPIFEPLRRRQIVTVVIGGPNAVYDFPVAHAKRLGSQLAGLAQAHGLALAVTTSRRTPADVVAALKLALHRLPGVFWDANLDANSKETSPNPYLGYLAHADWILVTGDSVNMVSEAAGTGKPVYIIDLHGGSEKFKRFHTAMRSAKITRSFTGRLDEWRYDLPDDTAKVAAQIKANLAQRQGPPS